MSLRWLSLASLFACSTAVDATAPAPPPTGPRLLVEGTCPGTLDVTATGLTPGGTFALLSSSTAGDAPLPPAAPCALSTGLAAPYTLRVLGQADAVGALSMSPTIPATACGQLIQVVDASSCAATNVAALPSVILGDVVVTTQADIDALVGVVEITGRLTIDGPGVTDLSPLASLERVGGRFLLLEANSVDSLAELTSLTEVGGDLWLQATAVTTLAGLEGVSLGGLTLERNASLTQLVPMVSGPGGLDGSLELIDNDALTDLSPLAGLTEVSSLTVDGNDGLTDLDAFANLTTLGGWLIVDDNASLTQVDGLLGVVFVPRILSVSFNPLLTDIDGLEGSRNVTSHVYVRGNDSLCQTLVDDWRRGVLIGGANIELSDNDDGC